MTERNIGFEIKTLSNLMRRKMEAEIGVEKSIRGNHCYILDFIQREKDRDIFQKDIEKEFQIRRSTATGILNTMQKRGLIERVYCEEDARQKKIVITEKGKRLQAKSFKKMQEFERKIKDGLTEEEVDEFLIITDKIKDIIDKIELEDK